MVGGGVAAFDCTGDGFPDLLLSGGSAPAKFYLNIMRSLTSCSCGSGKIW